MEDNKDISPEPLSRKKAAQERKKEEKRKRDKEYYSKNREKKLAQVKKRREEIRDLSRRPATRARDTDLEKKKRKTLKERETARKELQNKRSKVRQQTRERVRRYREKIRQEKTVNLCTITEDCDGNGFDNRTQKKRATDKVKEKLPSTPKKKADIVQTLASSPRTRKILSNRGIIKTPEEQKEFSTLKALASDISEGLSEIKRSSSNEKRAVFSTFKSLAFGENIKKSRAKKSLGKLINLNEKSIGKAISRRQSILKADAATWLHIKRKVRKDALSEEDTKTIFNYWTNTASRPTGDKKDTVKQRTGKQEYIHHAKHVLEKTQTEAFLEFKQLNPHINVKQRKFESLKPFFVKQAKERDRKSCLCRKHVEAQIVFKACMKFRTGLANRAASNDTDILRSVTEAAELTLCPKQDDDAYHKIECLERRCSECGVDKLKLLPEELSDEGSVRWSRYVYVPTGKFLANGQEKKKITLVQKETPPSELFLYFQELLEAYPLHSFMARWQREQLDNLVDNLPLGHVVCIHDYSEGYSCRQQDEIQSEYFDVAKASLHVTILYRHAIQAVDGEDSTEEEPLIIKEHLFVISDDQTQDQHSVHKVQMIIKSYLNDDIGYNVVKLHEFTDGCAAQYKSRHCIGDISCSLADFGFHVQRNFFETSHAKGEQDAAGSHVKQKVSQAVLRRTATINSAQSMHEYLTTSFSEPAATSFAARSKATQLKRRLFFYVPSEGEGAIDRKREGRKFKEVKGIRKWHCVKSLAQQEKVMVRYRSCYCISCILNDEESCTNKAWLDKWKEVDISRDGSVATTRQATEAPIVDHDTASHIADLVEKGSTVAIAADEDPMYDFYLLKVTSDGVEELESDFTDDYDNSALRGERVLKGNFYLRDNIHDMTFTLDEKRTAMVYAATVRHICGELPTKKQRRKTIYKLPLKENEEIIASF